MTKRNRWGLLAVCLVALFSLAGCTSVGAGHVGIEVHKAGGQRGVQDFPVTTGWVSYNPFVTEIVTYPTFIQTASWTRNPGEGHPTNEELTFSSKEGTGFTADMSLSYRLEPMKAPAFYNQFKLENIDGFTYGFLRNVARDRLNEVAGHYTVEQVMGDNGPLLSEVRKAIQAEVLSYGITIEQFGLIGRPRPPQEIDTILSAKVTAQQTALQKQMEVAQAEADARKNIAWAQGDAQAQITRAKGEAESNEVRNRSLTPALLELKRLEVQSKQIDKWNGQLPTVTSGGSGLLLQMPSK